MAFRSPIQKRLAAEIVAKLDADKIAEAIRLGAPESWGAAQFEQIGDMVYLAAETWIPQDYNDLTISHIEIKERIDTISPPTSIICDLKGTINPSHKSESIRDKSFVLDWKSATTLDGRWQDRMRDSWQWRTYLAHTGADVFIYRGVEKDATGTEELILPRYPGIEDDVREYYAATASMIHSLYNYDVWPRNMPGACGAFGRTCTHLEDCRSSTMPRQLIQINSLSYSAAEHFHLCPERYRREVISGPGESIELQIGNAFHRGMAELYAQLTGYILASTAIA